MTNPPLLGEGLRDRAVIVTGGASGIGRETVKGLALAGARVAVVDRDEQGITETVESLEDPSRHLKLPYDLSDIAGLPALVGEVEESLGDLWGLVNVAAVLVRRPIDDVTEEVWDLQHDVNLKASFFLNRAVGQALILRNAGGRIINFTSTSFLMGANSQSDAYVASKGGVVSMTRSFARAYGPHGILVNCVSPGQIDTPMQHLAPPDVVGALTETCPLGRMGKPEEVAAMAIFLASTNSSFVHGSTIVVGGGVVLY